MSDAAARQRNKIWTTPLRDLLRGRITGRVDWRSRLDAASLAVPIPQTIAGVVKRTRLWRLEKAAVADELIAHFQDGLAAGTGAAELVEHFGDQRATAKLIRRAKRRGRPMVWQVWNVCMRGLAVLLAIYSVVLIRFCIGRPSPSVDYVARLNEPILKMADSDRAWPLWREAILDCADRTKDGSLTISEAVDQGDVSWLDAHAQGIELARQAGTRPALGFVLGPGGSQNDLQLLTNMKAANSPDQPLIFYPLLHLVYLRDIANALSVDVKYAAETHDGLRVGRDLTAIIGLARQLRESDHILMTQLVALGINDGLAVEYLQRVLYRHADLLSDQQWIAFAHLLAGPRVAGDLMKLDGERFFFDDIVQRVYTDDGHGDGRLTLAGVKQLPRLMGVNNGTGGGTHPAIEAAGDLTLPLLGASRADLMAQYNQLMNQVQANFQRPLRLAHWKSVDSEIDKYRSPVGIVRYVVLSIMDPSLERIQQTCERYLANRDGTLTAIALELYRRHTGRYPATLGELTPQFLPEIPADRITGDPIKYRLIHGKPVIYSVGADRVDDGGVPPKSSRGQSTRYDAARWDVKTADAPRGDWVLYPPDGE